MNFSVGLSLALLLPPLALASACAADDDGGLDGADAGATTAPMDDADAEPNDADPGDTDPGATSGEPPLEACVPVTEADPSFTVALDGVPAWANDSPIDGLGSSFNLADAFADLNGDCDVLAQDGNDVSLGCTDADGTAVQVDLALPASVSIETLPAVVQFRYLLTYGTEEFGTPDSGGHAFVLFADAELVAAGERGRFADFNGDLPRIVPDAAGFETSPPECGPATVEGKCWGLQALDVEVDLGGETATLRSGERGVVGGYQVELGVVENTVDLSVPDPDDAGGEGCGVFTLRHALVVRAAR